MKIASVAAIFSAILVLSGCVAPYTMKNPFNEQEFSSYAYTGTASISGQAFLKTRGGEVRYAAGNRVLLIPATKFTQELDQVDQGRPMSPPKGTSLGKYVRSTTADGSGNFAFSGLNAGYYYVECGIYWMAGNSETGSTVRKLYQIGAGEKARVILTE